MRLLSIALVSILCLASVDDVQGSLSAPIPFAKLSEDESRILVVRGGGSGFSDRQVENPRLSNGDEIDFLSQFPDSGVYTLPDRTKVYAIDWFCLERELLYDPSLAHIARINRFGYDWALKFYSDGNETSSYTLNELLTAFKSERFRPFVIRDYFHPWNESLDLRGSQVIVTTVNRQIARFPIGYHEVHTFEMATGAHVETKVRKGRVVALFVGIVGFFLILVTSLVLAIRAKRNKNRQNKSKHPL